MKKELVSIVFLFIALYTYSFAAEVDKADQSHQDNLKQTEIISGDVEENVIINPMNSNETMKSKKNSAFKRFFNKRKSKLFEKLDVEDMAKPNRILVLMIIGFLLLLPGMILAMLGVALIPAIVLAVLGGTLMIIGVLAGN